MRAQNHGRGGERGFTLVELLVSMTVLLIISVMLVSITSATQRIWKSTNETIYQFSAAQQGFEAITRRLSQATLNTYWDYQYPLTSGAPDRTKVPTSYGRQSELRFLSGDATALGINSGGSRPTHAVFFQAPLGYVEDVTNYARLDTLLNTWGYYVEYTDDANLRPDFLNKMNPGPAKRTRFRLMEMTQPAEALTSIYQYTTNPPNASYTGRDWFSGALNAAAPATPPVHLLAENIVALVLLPRLTPQDEAKLTGGAATSTGTALSPTYLYDSTLTSNQTPPPSTPNPALSPKNQLPPVVQVTMVAVSESSYARTQPDAAKLGLGNLFQQAGSLTDPTVPGYAQDLQTLEGNLQNLHIEYRVFSTAVTLKAAKWSRQ